MTTAAYEVFVPAHITGFFSVHPDPDHRRMGSRGAGLTLTHGVSVRIAHAETTSVVYNEQEIQVDPVRRILSQFDTTASITIESEVPLGAGFGTSGAMALGTAIGLNALSKEHRTANELVALAHVAEVEAGTGLGDVVAQQRGGIPLRIAPGASPHGKLDGIFADVQIEYLTLGTLSTEEILDGELGAINQAGETAMKRLREEPTILRFMEESRQFAASANLLHPDVGEMIEEVDAAGGTAAMAMLGQTVFSLGTGLSDAGFDPNVCRVDYGGARPRTDDGAF